MILSALFLDLRTAWAASSMISWLSLDSAMFSLSCLMPVPPVFFVPFRSMILSALFFAAAPSGIVAIRSFTTSNSPLKSASLLGSITYLSVLSRVGVTPGTVSTRPSKLAEIWNSLKRQLMTQPVVARDSPTWSLTMTGVLMVVPTRVLHRMSQSVSRGEAELQTGTRQWISPGNFSFICSTTWLRLFSSLTSTSDSFLLTSTILSLPPLVLFLPSHSPRKAFSCSLMMSLVTPPSSAYSPILLAGRAQIGVPLTYTVGSWRRLNQMMGP